MQYILVVVGRKEKDSVDAVITECSVELQQIYGQTKEGNGQKWLMIDLEESGATYRDVMRLVEIRQRA